MIRHVATLSATVGRRHRWFRRSLALTSPDLRRYRFGRFRSGLKAREDHNVQMGDYWLPPGTFARWSLCGEILLVYDYRTTERDFSNLDTDRCVVLFSGSARENRLAGTHATAVNALHTATLQVILGISTLMAVPVFLELPICTGVASAAVQFRVCWFGGEFVKVCFDNDLIVRHGGRDHGIRLINGAAVQRAVGIDEYRDNTTDQQQERRPHRWPSIYPLPFALLLRGCNKIVTAQPKGASQSLSGNRIERNESALNDRNAIEQLHFGGARPTWIGSGCFV
jgi:hypothetical protein